MAQNISRFLQLDDKILLEYVINNASTQDEINSSKMMVDINKNNVAIININSNQILDKDNTNTTFNERMYIEQTDLVNSSTNNCIKNMALPANTLQDTWFTPKSVIGIESFNGYHDNYNNNTYDIEHLFQYDTIKLHVLAGYSFTDIFGILLQIKSKDRNNKNVSLGNFLYRRSDRLFNYEKQPMYINEKIYDKYIEIKIPSCKWMRQTLNTTDGLKFLCDNLNMSDSRGMADIEITYSRILKDDVYESDDKLGYIFTLDNKMHISVPYDSPSDKFNIYLSESTNGNYLNFYSTWDNEPINIDIINSLNTYIKLYDPINDYDMDAGYYDDIDIKERWNIYHEIKTSFLDSDGNDVLPTQTYILNQTFSSANDQYKFYYRPIINNDVNVQLLSMLKFEYIARLINKYDGTQIIRRGTIITENVNRYIDSVLKLAENEIIFTHKVYNKIVNSEISPYSNNNTELQSKYVKIFYNTKDVQVNGMNTLTNAVNFYGTGGIYLFNLTDLKNGVNTPLDLNNMCSYILLFKDKNNIDVTVDCTYSSNMNLSLGQVEFNINGAVMDKLKTVPDNDKLISIMAKNITGELSTVARFRYTIDKFN